MDLNPVENQRNQRVTSSVTSTKRNPKRKRAYIPRKTRKFQLRNNHPQDMHVAEILDYARTERREVTMIRDAIQLQHSLERGDLSVLLQRFPWVVEALKPPPAPSGAGGLDEIKGMLEIVIATQKTGNKYDMQSAQPSTGLPAAPIAEVKTAVAVSADDIADNFLSMFN